MAAIGIFDSGVGGLTVLRALRQALPAESFEYLGDTARLPYGSKSPETIRRYLAQNIAFLRGLGVKAIVVACNSASTAIADSHWDGLPIYGVIEPGARAARQASRGGRIGVLGTRATVSSGAYVHALRELDADLDVIQQACPLLVPLVEEGLETDPVTKTILARYLEGFADKAVDTVILGCTHYPVLKGLIRELTGPDVALVDSAEVVAGLLAADLATGVIADTAASQPGASQPWARIWTTDTAAAVKAVGMRILGEPAGVTWHLADLHAS